MNSRDVLRYSRSNAPSTNLFHRRNPIFQKHHPSVLEAIDRISKAAQRAGVPAGMAGLTNKEEAVGWLCEGFQFATLGNTFGVLMRASQEFITGVREAIGKRGLAR